MSRTQLLSEGINRHAIGHRIARGRLHAVHRGVYAVGHRRLTGEGRWMAAVLATDGVLSHRGAAALWGIFPSTYLEVIVPSIRRRPGLHVHRSMLPADEVTIERGIRVTGVWRTVLDLASVVRIRSVERAFNEAEVRGLTDPVSLPQLIERHPNHPGSPVVRGILAMGAVMTRSELEGLFLDTIARHNLPPPDVNAQLLVAGKWLECDCVWRAQRLIVELDGRVFHATAGAFERDRARDRRLQAAGWTVVRITWRQLRDESESVIADLRALLTATATDSSRNRTITKRKLRARR